MITSFVFTDHKTSSVNNREITYSTYSLSNEDYTSQYGFYTPVTAESLEEEILYLMKPFEKPELIYFILKHPELIIEEYIKNQERNDH